MPRTYVDNAYNRNVGRVGMPHGSAVISKNTVCGINTKTYVDNAYNRREGRVGMPHGSAVISKYSDGLTTWNYLDTDRRERQVCPTTPKTKYSEHALVSSEDVKEQYKKTVIQLKTEIQELTDNKKSQEASRQKTEDTYSQQMKKMSEQIQKQKDELDQIRRKNFVLQQQADASVKQCNDYKQQLHDLQENTLPDRERLIVQMRNQLKEHKDEHTRARQEVNHLQNELQRLQVYEHRCFEQHTELRDYRENILPEKEGIIVNLSTEVAQVSDHLNAKENEVESLKEQVQQLGKYLHICYDLNDQLNDAHENVIPTKDKTISELQSHVEKLFNDFTTLKRIAVPVSELEVLPETNLSRAIQQLQHFYDREYRSRYDITAKMEAMLQIRIETVMSELCRHKEIGDQIALVITTYTSMVQENSNLHRSLRTKEDELKHLKAELRHTKVKKLEMEKRTRYTI